MGPNFIRNTRRSHQHYIELLKVLKTSISFLFILVYYLWALDREADPVRGYHPVWPADYWFSIGEYICLRFSECLNPVFYNFGNPRMKRCTLKLLSSILPFSRRLAARANPFHSTSTYHVTSGATVKTVAKTCELQVAKNKNISTIEVVVNTIEVDLTNYESPEQRRRQNGTTKKKKQIHDTVAI